MMLDTIVNILKTEFHCKSGLELLFIPIGCYMFSIMMAYNKKRFESMLEKKEFLPFGILIKEAIKETNANMIKILLLFPAFALILMVMFNRIDVFVIIIIILIGCILFNLLRKSILSKFFFGSFFFRKKK